MSATFRSTGSTNKLRDMAGIAVLITVLSTASIKNEREIINGIILCAENSLASAVTIIQEYKSAYSEPA